MGRGNLSALSEMPSELEQVSRRRGVTGLDLQLVLRSLCGWELVVSTR